MMLANAVTTKYLDNCYRAVTGRHVTRASATTKIKMCLVFIFGGTHALSHLIFFEKKYPNGPRNGHAPADCRTFLDFIFWLVSKKNQERNCAEHTLQSLLNSSTIL
jgi:hypothetical protein